MEVKGQSSSAGKHEDRASHKRKATASPAGAKQPQHKRANNGSSKPSAPSKASKSTPKNGPRDTKQTNNARQRARVKQNAARNIAAQMSASAFANGELNTTSFVNARAFEINALESALARSRAAGSTRAFQSVPRDLRRRGASHDARRVPKRLRGRAKREMKEDNTPSRKTLRAERDKGGKGRAEKGKRMLRKDIAKRLKRIGLDARTGAGQKKKSKDGNDTPASSEIKKDGEGDTNMVEVPTKPEQSTSSKKKRATRKAKLAKPPQPPSKFRKRQLQKAWLPTHLYHAKRAHMTPPQQPIWRFSVPVTPTEKSYRASHRASINRGALAWDVSYTSTIRIEGPEPSCLNLLRGLSISIVDSKRTNELRRWLEGSRAWRGWAFEREGSKEPIAPVDIICAAKTSGPIKGSRRKRKDVRTLLIRVHPSAFRQIWEEVVRLSKVQKPSVEVEDLRFEVGSIDITGPSAGELLAGVLWPNQTTTSSSEDSQKHGEVEDVWKLLPGVTNLSSLPTGAIFAVDISDPRLHHPSQTTKALSNSQHAQLLAYLASWPLDQPSAGGDETSKLQRSGIFDREARQSACRLLPSQKAINRRKALAPPGQYPEPKTTDPKIPILAYVRHSSSPSGIQQHGGRDSRHDMGSITLLAPWKCIRSLWYCLMYYKLSSGGTPRFGGLQETRQIAFETSAPWFPGDYPATRAGKVWESKEQQVRKEAWERRPKARRVEWESVPLGPDQKGEIGLGWACDWDFLIKGRNEPEGAVQKTEAQETSNTETIQLTHDQATQRIKEKEESCTDSKLGNGDALHRHELAAVKLSMVSRGYPTACARIYRLPLEDDALRAQWIKILHNKQPCNGKQKPVDRRLISKENIEPDHNSRQRLAAGLLAPISPLDGVSGTKPGQADYPAVPDSSDLVGFVTTGNFNLGEGKATAVGSILLARVLEYRAKRPAKNEGRICIVREAGQNVGRLARWELV